MENEFYCVFTERQGVPSLFDCIKPPCYMAATAGGIFVLGRRLFQRPCSARAQKVVTVLSKATFGVYLVHPILIDAVKKLGLETITFNPYLSVPVITVLVFLSSYLVSLLLNLIPFVKKYIV